jgi:hypothetical protein
VAQGQVGHRREEGVAAEVHRRAKANAGADCAGAVPREIDRGLAPSLEGIPLPTALKLRELLRGRRGEAGLVGRRRLSGDVNPSNGLAAEPRLSPRLLAGLLRQLFERIGEVIQPPTRA